MTGNALVVWRADKTDHVRIHRLKGQVDSHAATAMAAAMAATQLNEALEKARDDAARGLFNEVRGGDAHELAAA